MGGCCVTRTNFYAQHTDADPTRRSYSVGEQAASTVVQMTAEADTVAVDLETAGLDELAFKVKVMIISTDRHACVLDSRSPIHRKACFDALRTARRLIFHNASFDVPPLVTSGLMHLDDIDKVFDTLVCARMALTGFAARRGLGDLEKRYLRGSLRSETKDRFGDWAKVNGLSKSKAFAVAGYDHPVYQMYAGWDGILTSMVLPHVLADARKQLIDHPFGRYGADAQTADYLIEREQRVNRIMLRRSARGLVVDPARIDREQDQLRGQMNTLADKLAAFGVTDPSNRNQLAVVLDQAGALEEDYPRTATGKVSTAKENLDAIDHPAVRAFRGHDDRRRLFTYLEHARLVAERTDGRIHPQCNVLHARTGRMSYSNPEVHQFIADARTVVERDPEHHGLVSIDWSSIEPVTVANLSGDLAPIKKFENGHKLYDVVSTAARVPYKTAKMVLLAALYGQGLRSLASRLNVDPDQAKALQAQVFEAMPMTRRFIGWSTAWSEEVGKTWTLSGRIIDVDREVGYKGTNYCLAPDTPILRSDLCHVAASKISVGDRLVAFDENPASTCREGHGKRYRRMRTAVVEKTSTVVKKSVTVYTAGAQSITCSADHLWLVRPKKPRKGVSRNLWVQADGLQPGDMLLSLGGTWEASNTRAAGYLAGLYDGEGYLRRRAIGQTAGLGFSQLSGPVMNQFCASMYSLGLAYSYLARSPQNTSPTDNVLVYGVKNVLRVLGIIQPERFRSRFEEVYEGAFITAGLTESVDVLAVEETGELELTSIQTSTRTLIANGFLSHNCVQGSAYDVLAESIVAIDDAGLADGLYLAMHDELVVAEEIAHDVRCIMQRPPDRLVELSGRVPKLRTDAAYLGDRWDDADRCPSWPVEDAA